jgi:hypothetical protein
LKGNNDRYPALLFLFGAIQTYRRIQNVSTDDAENIVFGSLMSETTEPGNIFNLPFPSTITPEILTDNDLLWQINQLIQNVEPGFVDDIVSESSVIERVLRCFTG